MAITSETEATLTHQAEQVLTVLPVVRRWLVRSVPRGHRPPAFGPLTVAHARALLHLYQHGAMTIGELARGLGVSFPTASECVAGLEAQGRVVRERSEPDRRQVIVRLTPEAEAVAGYAFTQRKVLVERVLQRLSPRERGVFVQGLLLLAQEVEAWLAQTSSSEQGPGKGESVVAK